MDRIDTSSSSFGGFNADFEKNVITSNKKKKSIAKGFMAYAGICTGIFICFAVVVIVTTKITLNFEALATVALDLFLLLFCAYSMYYNCSDSGMRHGLMTDSYKQSCIKYEELKKYVIERKMQANLSKFCRYYVVHELEEARTDILAVVGFGYAEYVEKYQHLDNKTIDKLELSKKQKKALKQANKIQPVHLTPEMIMRRGRGHSRREPLGVKPETRKAVAYSGKFVQLVVTSLLFSIIAFDIVEEPSWVIFASVCLKLVMVVTTGFQGYKFGFENIVLDTVNYQDDQADLIKQAIQYIEEMDKDEEVKQNI